jgi:hypothetical protein
MKKFELVIAGGGLTAARAIKSYRESDGRGQIALLVIPESRSLDILARSAGGPGRTRLLRRRQCHRRLLRRWPPSRIAPHGPGRRTRAPAAGVDGTAAPLHATCCP